MRTKARNAGGTPSSTAILMNRYGMPQRVDTAAKAAQARGLTARTLPGRCGRPGGRQVRQRVELGQRDDALLLVGVRARDDGLDGLVAEVRGQVWDAGGAVDELAGADNLMVLQARAPPELGAPADHVDRRLVAVVQVRPCARAGRHRQTVEADA